MAGWQSLRGSECGKWAAGVHEQAGQIGNEGGSGEKEKEGK